MPLFKCNNMYGWWADIGATKLDIQKSPSEEWRLASALLLWLLGPSLCFIASLIPTVFRSRDLVGHWQVLRKLYAIHLKGHANNSGDTWVEAGNWIRKKGIGIGCICKTGGDQYIPNQVLRCEVLIQNFPGSPGEGPRLYMSDDEGSTIPPYQPGLGGYGKIPRLGGALNESTQHHCAFVFVDWNQISRLPSSPCRYRAVRAMSCGKIGKGMLGSLAASKVPRRLEMKRNLATLRQELLRIRQSSRLASDEVSEGVGIGQYPSRRLVSLNAQALIYPL